MVVTFMSKQHDMWAVCAAISLVRKSVAGTVLGIKDIGAQRPSTSLPYCLLLKAMKIEDISAELFSALSPLLFLCTALLTCPPPPNSTPPPQPHTQCFICLLLLVLHQSHLITHTPVCLMPLTGSSPRTALSPNSLLYCYCYCYMVQDLA